MIGTSKISKKKRDKIRKSKFVDKNKNSSYF